MATDQEPGTGRPLWEALKRAYISADRPPVTKIARDLHYDRGTIARIFRGEQEPTRKQFVALARRLGKDPDVYGRMWDEASGAVERTLDPGRPTESGSAGRTRESVDITYYSRTAAFYDALDQRIRDAEYEVRVTYIRQFPPGRFLNPTAKGYFDGVLQWAEQGADRQLSRVIGVPMSDGDRDETFMEWLRAHQDEARRLPNYEPRVVDWPIASDAMNLAIIDRKTTFVTFSGMHPQQLSGFTVDSEAYASMYMEYWNQLWPAARSLDMYLRGRGSLPP